MTLDFTSDACHHFTTKDISGTVQFPKFLLLGEIIASQYRKSVMTLRQETNRILDG